MPAEGRGHPRLRLRCPGTAVGVIVGPFVVGPVLGGLVPRAGHSRRLLPAAGRAILAGERAHFYPASEWHWRHSEVFSCPARTWLGCVSSWIPPGAGPAHRWVAGPESVGRAERTKNTTLATHLCAATRVEPPPEDPCPFVQWVLLEPSGRRTWLGNNPPHNSIHSSAVENRPPASRRGDRGRCPASCQLTERAIIASWAEENTLPTLSTRQGMV